MVVDSRARAATPKRWNVEAQCNEVRFRLSRNAYYTVCPTWDFWCREPCEKSCPWSADSNNPLCSRVVALDCPIVGLRRVKAIDKRKRYWLPPNPTICVSASFYNQCPKTREWIVNSFLSSTHVLDFEKWSKVITDLGHLLSELEHCAKSSWQVSKCVLTASKSGCKSSWVDGF